MKSNKRVLVVVDYQKDFVDGVLGIPNANKLATFIQNEINNGMYDEILYTFDTHTKKDYEKSEEKKLFNDIHCEYKTPGWELFNITPRDNIGFKEMISGMKYPFGLIKIQNEYFFTKDKFDIWTNKYFKKLIETEYDKDNNEFFFVGVATEFCVNMNIKGFVDRGYKVNVLNQGIKAIDDNNGIEALNNYGNKINIIN